MSDFPPQAPREEGLDRALQQIARERDEARAEVERLRGWLREFADRIQRDRREPDKVLIEVTSMRAIADGLRTTEPPMSRAREAS